MSLSPKAILNPLWDKTEYKFKKKIKSLVYRIIFL